MHGVTVVNPPIRTEAATAVSRAMPNVIKFVILCLSAKRMVPPKVGHNLHNHVSGTQLRDSKTQSLPTSFSDFGSVFFV
jgi:hypothetical protein